MSVTHAEQLSGEILDAVDQPEQLKHWLRQKLEDPSEEAILGEACVLTTESLLGADPPQAAAWEQLFIQLAAQSHERKLHLGLDQCKAVLGKLRDMIDTDRLASCDRRKVVTIAGALTIALTAQRKLRQPIEELMETLCEKFEDQLPAIGQLCQDIWRRKGQMSGESGLFLWDTRRGEWRLTRDFKANHNDR